MRKVIQISGGVFLCDDGTMWEIIKGGQGRKTWGQIPNVPQPEEPDYEEEVKANLRKRAADYKESIKSRDY